jgi:hypothetical protein
MAGDRALRVQNPLRERVRDRLTDHLVGEPVRGVVLPELLPGLGADDGFAQDLQDIVLDGAPVEAAEPTGKGPHEPVPLRHLDHPVEEVGLDDAVDAALIEPGAGEQRLQDDVLDRETWNGVGDDLGRVHEECVPARRPALLRRPSLWGSRLARQPFTITVERYSYLSTGKLQGCSRVARRSR